MSDGAETASREPGHRHGIVGLEAEEPEQALPTFAEVPTFVEEVTAKL